MFLRIGSATEGKPLSLWGKGKFFAGSVIKISNAVTLCSMTAASEMTFYSLFGFHGGGIITGILALIVVLFGVDKIKASNFFIVPIIIILIGILLFKESVIPDGGKFVFLPAFSYCTMNIIGGGYLISTMSSDFDKKDCAVTSIICTAVVTVLIMAVYFTIQNYADDDMPLMSAATACNLKILGNITMYLAVFTTMTGSLSIVSDNKTFPAIAATAFSFGVSALGFRKIVDCFYPILGVLGGVVAVAYLIIFIIKNRRQDKSPLPIMNKKTMFL